MTALKIQTINNSDIEVFSEVATRAYFDHYKHLWFDHGQWYAQRCFNTQQLSDEMADDKNLFFFAIVNEIPVGFLKLRPQNQLADQKGVGFEIERIYLTNEATGQGIGRKLMDFAIEMARQQQKDYVWLKAMDSSQNAIRFYESLGFEICGTSRLTFEQMKEEYKGMVTMKKNLN
ncbi:MULTISPECIES: GNAT family N-acetyltransferase [Emticicia]|nr:MULTISPECIES: GNAT family N-acetyltransferase [Emticicia]